ncbi:MAG: hypothetical protein PF542_06130 [Nanoarchaeota archaeon]|jgi:DNA topoisomerase IB|nr:hypothetical protein [Nanoarchaeota archaeon]
MKECEPGTIRIKIKDLKPYEKTKTSWKKSKRKLPLTDIVIKLFKANNNLKLLIDKNNKEFLKGQISPENKIEGERLNILPNGKKLTGAYSLFAKNLTIHDEDSDDHWDAIYENPSGFCYLYDEEKIKKHKNKKYSKVKEFEKIHLELEKKVYEALYNKKDYMATPMYTLLKTYMRVGNETYYNHNGHKGLTTLTKNNIKIKNNIATFKFIAKDGVPMSITHEFPDQYISRLKSLLRQPSTVNSQQTYIFKSPAGKILKDTHFKKAFKKHIGKEFYPHIVRSFYATHETKEFLRHHKKATKKEVREFLIHVAHELGHRKFNKKTSEWQESYAVTISHYIAPNYAEKLRNLAK